MSPGRIPPRDRLPRPSTFLKASLLFVANQKRIYDFVMRHDLLREVAWRYVAGEQLADGIAIAQALNLQGLRVSLDHLGENVASEADAAEAVQAYLDALDAMAAADIDGYVSLKLTQMGLDLSRELCVANVRRILDRARERGNLFVRLDMESSSYTQRTLEIHEELWSRLGYQNVGIVLQACLYRTAADVEGAIRLGAPVRLCKGAYLEPPEVAYQDKAAVDRNYLVLMQRLLEHGNQPAIATHDGRLIRHALSFARRHEIDASRYQFEMLFGVRRDLQTQLAALGNRMNVYVPYGRQWYPYLVRRLAERPANLSFFVRAFAAETLARR